MEKSFLLEFKEILEKLGLKIFQFSEDKNYFVFECDVWAKPGSKKEGLEISNEGTLLVKTKAKPVDGEANKSIIEMISKLISVPKSNIEIIRGDKSKSKRIKILVEITANKNKKFYREKLTSISKEVA